MSELGLLTLEGVGEFRLLFPCGERLAMGIGDLGEPCELDATSGFSSSFLVVGGVGVVPLSTSLRFT